MFRLKVKVLPALLLLTVLAFVHSCNDLAETSHVPEVELSEEAALKMLMEGIAAHEEGKQYIEVDQIDGKTALDYYLELEQGIQGRGAGECQNTPNCPKQHVTGVFNFNAGCDIAYSYDLYNCGSGNLAIFNFQMAPVVGSNCLTYNILVTQNYNSGDLQQYQENYNLFAILILSDIEDTLFALGQTFVASYIPNICSVVCQSNGAQEECGEDCCIRLAHYNHSTKSRTTTVFSAGECGGTIATCSNGSSGDCENFNCAHLDEYR